MLLAIDAGNTNTVFAVFDRAGELKATWRAVTKTDRTADELGIWLRTLIDLEGLKPEDITRAMIASVVPTAVFNLKTLCQRYFNVTALVVDEPNVDLGIEVKIDRPEQVGADRLVNTVAANAAHGGDGTPLIIVDFGTATTFDLIDGEGAYAGGVIAPGLNLSLEALERAAAKLPHIEVRKPDRVVGKHTVEAMQSGIFWGYVGLIEGIVTRIRAENDAPNARVIATGGLAKMFEEATDAIDHVEDDLTLRGLYLIHQANS